MARYTLKEAADLTGRSVTTLRRYIRSGRLQAEKTPGRFGPEYTLDEPALLAAGFQFQPEPPRAEPGERPAPPVPAWPVQRPPAPAAPAPAFGNGARPLEKVLQDYVPADLYRELAMKHEQLLVQYGMVRASGQRLFEFRDEAEQRAEELRRSEERTKDLQDRLAREIGFLKRHLREAELEIEGKNMEMVALREKMRVLELLTRNAITNESIDRQFHQIFEKEREIDALLTGLGPGAPAPPGADEPGPAASEEPPRPPSADEERRTGLRTLGPWLAPGRPIPEPEGPDH